MHYVNFETTAELLLSPVEVLVILVNNDIRHMETIIGSKLRNESAIENYT
jgi:hypothetical protein